MVRGRRCIRTPRCRLTATAGAEEDKARPHSDDQLVELLGGKGVHIARRTVTKYRKALGIESSSRRKEY